MTKPHLIAIVDDDADDREIIRDAFASVGPGGEYLFFENGEKLIEHMKACVPEAYPSLVMLDLNMPGKDGRETLKELKADARYQPIPAIVFTTSSSQRDRDTVYNLGANCFITKPDTFNKLTQLATHISNLWLV